MKADIDRIMAERDLDALVIFIGEEYSAALDYLVGRVRLTGGLAVKKRDVDPVLVVGGMETAEAAVSGLQVLAYSHYKLHELLEQNDNNGSYAYAAMLAAALAEQGVPAGKVGIYGTVEVNTVLDVLNRLRETHPDYTFVGDGGRTLFDRAAATKTADEIDRIKSVAARTSEVLQATWDFISGHKVDGETVVKADGGPLTIGDVKRFVRAALLERDLQEAGMIFAQGRDAGFPHSRGQADMPLKLGQSIVFDLFPYELGGGYHHDVTRTWCIGHASDEVQVIYKLVRDAYDIAIEHYTLGKPTHLMQEAVQDFLEAAGHATSRSEPGTEAGYVHSLGHGLGLKVHEAPYISHTRKDDAFAAGHVVTIEPGLYYPEKGYGVRYENTLYISEAGELVNITDFHDKLVLPLKGS